MFHTLITSNEDAGEVEINDTWENIRNNIKVAAGESIDYYEIKKKKPWFDDDCSSVVERRIRPKRFFCRIKQNLIGIRITMKDVRPFVHLGTKRDYVKSKTERKRNHQ